MRLERICGRRLNLRINDNVSSLLNVTYPRARPKDPAGRKEINVSINRIFLQAPPEVIEAVGQFIRRATQKNRTIIRRFIYENWHKIRSPSAPRRLVVKGKYFNLAEVLKKVNREYFQGKLRVRISWSLPRGRLDTVASDKTEHKRRRRKRSFRYIQFAAYDETHRLIRVNPRLDNKRVPSYFMEYIIYHEMLHSIIPPRLTPSGRLVYHTPEFRRRERLFKYYEKARQWEENCFDKI
ncbi:M48 family metallopeptidase [Candidatus Sumerlaeota bacterium]|nr:M48 family metallopeptidase [Candidatus Sumerlaeota bacterium]